MAADREARQGWTRRMTKMPETLQRINSELRRRHAAGLSTDVVDFEWKPLLDDNVGVFSRLTFIFSDGDRFTFDTTEMPPEMRKALQEGAMQ